MKTYKVINLKKDIEGSRRMVIVKALNPEDAARKAGFDIMTVHHIFDNVYKPGKEVLSN